MGAAFVPPLLAYFSRPDSAAFLLDSHSEEPAFFPATKNPSFHLKSAFIRVNLRFTSHLFKANPQSVTKKALRIRKPPLKRIFLTLQ
jgi:hypothetical protein